MQQKLYVGRLEVLTKHRSFEKFRSRRHAFGRITHIRHDVTGDSALLAQFTKASIKKVHFIQLNHTIERIKLDPQLGLNVHKLDWESLKLISCLDASFAKAADLHSELLLVLFLCHECNRINWIHFRRYKCRRVVISVLGGKSHPFVYVSDASFATRHYLSKII